MATLWRTQRRIDTPVPIFTATSAGPGRHWQPAENRNFYMRLVYIFLLQISPLIVEVHLISDYSWPKNDLMIMNKISKQMNLND